MNGEPAVYLEVMATPSGNPLAISRDVKAVLNKLDLPAGSSMAIPYDVTVFIDAAIDNVLLKLVLASVEVVLVIFLFLDGISASDIQAAIETTTIERRRGKWENSRSEMSMPTRT